jgi:hypothetical protein
MLARFTAHRPFPLCALGSVPMSHNVPKCPIDFPISKTRNRNRDGSVPLLDQVAQNGPKWPTALAEPSVPHCNPHATRLTPNPRFHVVVLCGAAPAMDPVSSRLVSSQPNTSIPHPADAVKLGKPSHHAEVCAHFPETSAPSHFPGGIPAGVRGSSPASGKACSPRAPLWSIRCKAPKLSALPFDQAPARSLNNWRIFPFFERFWRSPALPSSALICSYACICGSNLLLSLPPRRWRRTRIRIQPLSYPRRVESGSQLRMGPAKVQ